ncbi:Branched-chain amino acid aminotransferase II [Fusarium albosuccineum]|uniref:Branched-chain-amino-acid aminotransferase n=1 Tax=Fusarium albosuccineum TaxID=1237068 RepID=A0A8H4LK48_9HYPO|nr:Branched-chain amino acid aminotransferase II [Fusarium albosuccineum]
MNHTKREQPLGASDVLYHHTTTPQPVPSEATILSSDESIATDHMIVATWEQGVGWSKPELKPYGPFSLTPTASCLHYATECFEGLKAYRGNDGNLRAFRIDRNVARLGTSAARISLPVPEPEEVKQLILTLLSTDAPRWLPRDSPGCYLYVRPTIIGTSAQLGVQAPRKAMLFIVLTYMARLDIPPGGLRLYTSPENAVRAWTGGFGYAKIGANYGPSVMILQEATKRGYHQVLWLYGQDGDCTEAGCCNFFVVWKRKDGKTELVTAPLDDKTILDGVTRRSCLGLARERLFGEIEVTERKFTIAEVMEACSEGRLLESFAAGTAYFISAVSQINHRGHNIEVPMGDDGKGRMMTMKIKNWLSGIMYGETEHEWAAIVQEVDSKA